MSRIGRPINASTPLGKIMVDRGITVKGLEADTGISYRTISDYLAGRKQIIAKHMAVLTDHLNVSKDVLLGYAPITSTQQPVVAPVSRTEIHEVMERWVELYDEGVAS
jgi:DNA-binding Xre family transcriptional regulator